MLWGIYTIAIGLVSFVGYFGNGMPRCVDLIDYLIFIVTYAGLISHVWSMALFTRRFWQCFWPLMLTWNLVYLYLIPVADPGDLVGMPQWVEGTLSLLLFLPTVVGVFVYAYRRRDVWESPR